MKMQIGKLIKQIGSFVTKNSPTILTGIGIAGLVSTTIFAVKATPKAVKILEDELSDLPDGSKLKKTEVVKLTWKCYIPTLVMGGITIGCMVGANSISAKRTAAMTSLYSLSELALKEYQSKVVEIVGQNKATQIKDEIAKDRINKNPKSDGQVIITGKGETLCYDILSDRYFKFDIEKIRKIENQINKTILSEDFVSVNDLYYELGLKNSDLGDDMGWDIDNNLNIEFSSQLSDDETPCLVINYKVVPRHK